MVNRQFKSTQTTKEAKTTSDSVETLKSEDQIIREQNWFLFARSFFGIASIGCDFLLTKRKTKEDEVIFLSVIYNLKHGIEVILKHFTISYDEKFKPKNDAHNFQETFNRLLKNTRIPKKATTSLKKIKPIINKYYDLNFVQISLSNSCKNSTPVIKDISNTIFKYPEFGSVEINYDYFLNSIDIKSLTEEIVKDIKLLSGAISSLKKN